MIRVFEVTVKVLTPLHIRGGPVALQRNWDYVVSGSKAYILAVDRIYRELWDGKDPVPSPAELLRRAQRLDSYAKYTLNLGQVNNPERIWPFIRDADERPYIPGSSLKGLIRTAIFWELYQPPVQLGSKDKLAAERMEKALLGSEPHYDVLRALRVSDLHLEGEPQSWVFPLELHSLDAKGSLKRVTPIGQGWDPLEIVGNGTKFRGTVSLDEYLLKNNGALRELMFQQQAMDAIERWPQVVARFGKALLDFHIRFYQNSSDPALANLLQKLLRGYETPACLGWGGGWPSKTVGLKLKPREIANVQQQFRLDRWKSAHFPDKFPVSRRLVRTPNGLRPLGWIQISVTQRQ